MFSFTALCDLDKHIVVDVSSEPQPPQPPDVQVVQFPRLLRVWALHPVGVTVSSTQWQLIDGMS